MEGHEPLMPHGMHHYDLHVWLWKENPAGLFQIGDARGQLHNLLLLERHQGEGGQKEVLHRKRCSSPIFRRNPRRWRARVHSSSMPGVSAAVKSAQDVGSTAVP